MTLARRPLHPQDVNWDRMAGMAAVLLRDVAAGTATDVSTYITAVNAVLSRSSGGWSEQGWHGA